jgi:hypothetical protein
MLKDYIKIKKYKAFRFIPDDLLTHEGRMNKRLSEWWRIREKEITSVVIDVLNHILSGTQRQDSLRWRHSTANENRVKQ